MEKHTAETIEETFHFQYPIRAKPVLQELKQRAGLEVDTQESETKQAQAIIGFTHGLFTHNGDNVPSAGDPLTILKEAQGGHSFRCVEYSTLAAGLLWAHGIPARTVGLKTADVETREYGAGHVVIEFWSKEFDKWIMSDVQAGVMPRDSDTPLSAYELRKRSDQGETVTYEPVPGSKFSQSSPYGDRPSYSEWLREYLYFIDTPAHLTLGNEDTRTQQIVMLVPKGAQTPEVFQGMFKMNAIYTHNAAEFYAQPPLAPNG